MSNSLRKINIASGNSLPKAKDRFPITIFTRYVGFSRVLDLRFAERFWIHFLETKELPTNSEVRKALTHDVLLMPHKIFSHCEVSNCEKDITQSASFQKKNVTEMFLVKGSS